jgi:vacuolar-type H+-ATPase subunit E/Vma4
MATQNVTEKILADAKKEAKETLDKYQKDAEQIKNEYAKKMTSEKDQITAETEDTKKTEILRTIAQKQLEINKQIVGIKRKFIENVIKDALKNLHRHKEYLNFLKSLIKKSGVKTGELMINKTDWRNHRTNLEKFMKAEGLNYKVNLEDKLIGGILLKKEKTTHHGTLNLINELLTDELTIAVSKTLY